MKWFLIRETLPALAVGMTRRTFTGEGLADADADADAAFSGLVVFGEVLVVVVEEEEDEATVVVGTGTNFGRGAYSSRAVLRF